MIAVAAALASPLPCSPIEEPLTLSGRLDADVAEDASGRAERFPVLRLDRAACVEVPSFEDPTRSVPTLATELQLVGTFDQIRSLLAHEVGPVWIVGRPEVGITAHHHTSLLLRVDAVDGAQRSR